MTLQMVSAITEDCLESNLSLLKPLRYSNETELQPAIKVRGPDSTKSSDALVN